MEKFSIFNLLGAIASANQKNPGETPPVREDAAPQNDEQRNAEPSKPKDNESNHEPSWQSRRMLEVMNRHETISRRIDQKPKR